jgi:hypothetical protein
MSFCCFLAGAAAPVSCASVSRVGSASVCAKESRCLRRSGCG